MRKAVVASALLLVPLPGLAASPLTIAALGDSLTQGYGLPEDEGFVPQLQEWLEEQGASVILINAGVSGDTTAGGRARVAWTLSGEVDAVIVALGANDVLRGIDPAVTRENLSAILSDISGHSLPVLLAGMRAPGNYGPDYKRNFDAIYPELAAEHGALLYPFFLQGLAAGEDLGAARALVQADGLHPNAQGVAAMVADIGPHVLELVRLAASNSNSSGEAETGSD